MRVPLDGWAKSAISGAAAALFLFVAAIMAVATVRIMLPEVGQPIVDFCASGVTAVLGLDQHEQTGSHKNGFDPRDWHDRELDLHAKQIGAALNDSAENSIDLLAVLRGAELPTHMLTDERPIFQDRVREPLDGDESSFLVVRYWKTDGCVQVISSKGRPGRDTEMISKFFPDWLQIGERLTKLEAPLAAEDFLLAALPGSAGFSFAVAAALMPGQKSESAVESPLAGKKPVNDCPPEDEDVDDERRYRCRAHTSIDRGRPACPGKTVREWTKIWSFYDDGCVSYYWKHNEFDAVSPEFFTTCTH